MEIIDYIRGTEEALRMIERIETEDIKNFLSYAVQQIGGGNKIMICGNGGSAADAQHFTAELVGRFKTNRRSFAALALTTDTSILTAVGNDFGYDKIFSRQIEGLGRNGDILIAISTSGNSPNIINAILTARERGIETIALTGGNGGRCKLVADRCFNIEVEQTCHVQEAHEVLLHYFANEIEERLL